MKNSPLVSVIIPTYNRASVVCSAIDNVLQQTYRNIEVIVVDDGSTDNTQEKLRKYGNRIRTVVQDNAGPAAARNRGLEIFRGEIVAFQDSDDLWEPTKLERQVDLLRRADESVVCCLCNAIVHFSDGTVTTSFENATIKPELEEGIWLNVAEILATRFVLFNQVVAIRRRAIRRIGFFDETLKYLEDYDLPLRLALAGPWGFIKKPLAVYRQGDLDSFSRRAWDDEVCLKDCEMRIFGSALARVTDREEYALLSKLLRQRLRWFRWGLRAAQLGRVKLPGAQPIANAFKRAERYRNAFFRRVPWFPKMQTAVVERTTSLKEEQKLAPSA